MKTVDATVGGPRSILLATDLSSDCDRALDRAVQLAGQWQATLHVVHALRPEQRVGAWWATEADPALPASTHLERVEQQIRRDLIAPPQDLRVHVEVGAPVEVITGLAEREHCELIIVGTSGPGFASRLLHTTTGALLRRLPFSLLVVKARPRGPYHQVLAGTDFTRESRHGLETAAQWLPTAEFTVMHALDIPYRSMFLQSGREGDFAQLEEATMAEFMAAVDLPEGLATRIRAHVAYGYPEAMLGAYAETHGIDLTVVGALRRGLVFRMLVGGNAARIVQGVAGDVLVLRDRKGAAESL